MNQQAPHGQPPTISGFWAKLLLAIAVGALLAIGVNFMQKYNSEQLTLKEYFIDINGDGDIDYVKKATVILNCGNKACQPAPAKSEPTPAPQAPPADPNVGGGVPGDTTDPNVGGGAPPPTPPTG